jgi:hypothetical protein
MSNRAVVYRTAPQKEFKAAEELTRAGYSPELPTETIERHTPGRKPTVRTVPIMRQYISANGKPHDAKYVKKAIGTVDPVEIIRLKTTMDRIQERALLATNPYQIGQPVSLGEVPGVVASTVGEQCFVAVTMLGKQHLRPVHYSRLRPG